MAKPRPEREIVFGTANRATRQMQRIKRVGKGVASVIDIVTLPAYAKKDAGRSQMEDRRYSQASIVDTSDLLRSKFDKEMQDGVVLKTTTKDGAIVTASARNGDSQYDKRVSWSLEIESPSGQATGFKVDAGTLYPGSRHGHERKSAHIDVVNLENGKEYPTYRYGDNGEFEVYASVATALGELVEAQEQGRLQVVPVPSEVLSQQELARVA